MRAEIGGIGEMMAGRQAPYLSYLLRLWMVEGDGPEWRASLENPATAERHGFASLDKLVAFLVAETTDLAAEEGWNPEGDSLTQEIRCDLPGRAGN